MCEIQSLLSLAMGASPPPGTQPNPTAQMLNMLMPLLLLGVMMYFMAIRPQRQRQKQLDALIKNLRPGDKVHTQSGIVGTVVSVRDTTVAIRSEDTKLEVLKSSIAFAEQKSTQPAEVKA